jgi:hypothetical protein
MDDATRITRTVRGELRLAHAIGQHITMRLSDDRVIAPSIADRRAAARVLLRHGTRAGLLAFRVVDTHVHVLVRCDRAVAGSFAHATEVALRATLRLPIPFEPARIRPVLDQPHLYRAFGYVLRQEIRHGTSMDPVHDGSSLPELLGLRVVDDLVAQRVAASLPRLDARSLVSLLEAPVPRVAGLGVGTMSGPIHDDDASRWPSDRRGESEASVEPARMRLGLHPEVGARREGDVELSRLADAAAAAYALGSLAGRAAPECAARHAAVWVARDAGASSSLIAEKLRMSQRNVRTLLARSPDLRAQRAVELQLRLRNRLVKRGSS